MKDISPELLQKIQNDFLKAVEGVTLNNYTYSGAYTYAEKIGEALAIAFKNNLSSAVLPDGKMYWNIANSVVSPMIEENYTMISNAATSVQQALNTAANIGLKAQSAPLNVDKINGILNKISSFEQYDDVADILYEPVKTFSFSVVDDVLKENINFQGKVGLTPQITRTAERRCCKWCSNLAGTYTYPSVPKDVYRRHERCRCIVEYSFNGSRQNVHTKKWTNANANDNIKTKYAPSPQRQKKGIQVSSGKYAQLTGNMNTHYPSLSPEDGFRTIYDGNYGYRVRADGYGGLIIHNRFEVK